MCRKLDDGSYRYCPSRLRRSKAYAGRGSDSFGVTPDGRVQHAGEVSPSVAADGFVMVAHTGAELAPVTVDALSKVAGVPLSAKAKFRLWSDVAAGSSVSGALTAMKATGHLAQFPELAALDGVQQDPYWHPEGDALTHMGMAGDHMTRQCETAGITGDERTLLVLAATFHDLGKATHTHVEDDGRITSRGHDDAGVAPAHRLLVAMDAPEVFHKKIEPLIREHMCAVSVKKMTKHAVRGLRTRLAPASFDEWVMVVNADHGGRGPASVDGYADEWAVLANSFTDAPAKRVYGLVSSRDVLDAGMKPGPEFGALLDEAQQAEEDGVFSDGAGAREWLRQRLTS